MTSAIQHLNSPAHLQLGLPFSEIVRAGDTLYLSGQIGNVPGTLTLAEGGLQGQARQCLRNVDAALQAHGYALSNVVKCTVFLADMADWPAFNQVWMEFFAPPCPARSALAAAGLALGARLELDVIAHVC